MRIIPLPAFSSVAANTTASLITQKCDNHSLHGILFQQGGGNNEANMNRIQVRYNEEDICNIQAHPVGPVSAGTMLKNWNNKKGLTITAGYLFLPFGNPEFKDPIHAHAGDLDCSVHKAAGGKAANLEIQVDLGAGVAPTLTAYAVLDAPKANYGMHPSDVVRHKKYVRTFLNLANAQARAEVPIGNAAKFEGSIVNQFYQHTNLTSLEVDKDSKQIWQDLTPALADALMALYGRPVIAGLYNYSPTHRGTLKDQVNTKRPDGNTALIEHLLTTSAADQITVTSEVICDQYSGKAAA